MGWQTNVSDGTKIGNISVIEDYARNNTDLYEEKKARIDGIAENGDNPEFVNYRIENEDGGGSNLIIRSTLTPEIYRVLELPESDELEGKIITAIWKDDFLTGFKAYQKE